MPKREGAGLRPASVAPTRERLTRERVVAAALAIVDRDGLDGLTMRALGRELGVDPMAAYYWFPNKPAILQGVVEAILAEIPVPPPDTVITWQDALRTISREYRHALLSHPNALPIAFTQPVLTPRGLQLIEVAAALLVRGGLTPAAAVEVINGAAALVIGGAIAEAGVTPGAEPIEQAEIEAAYSDLSPDHYPTILAALAAAGPDAFDSVLQFESLLDAYVRGLESRFGQLGPALGHGG